MPDGAIIYLKTDDKKPYIAAKIPPGDKLPDISETVKLIYPTDKLFFFDSETGKRVQPILLK